MCGIFFSLSTREHILPTQNTQELLERRGPDSSGKQFVTFAVSEDGPKFYATFISTVLSLRGDKVVTQPLTHGETGSVLCWNGEAWGLEDMPVAGNDSVAVFDILLKASAAHDETSRDVRIQRVYQAMASIRGPFSFVFFSPTLQCLFYGRDCLGRRSLLQKSTDKDTLVLSSVASSLASDSWSEVEADGICHVDLVECFISSMTLPSHAAHSCAIDINASQSYNASPFYPLNRLHEVCKASRISDSVSELSLALTKSLALRIQRVREAVDTPTQSAAQGGSADIAILFSGGLDCTLLARLAHDLLPHDQSIDLLNVAFENPRIHNGLQPDESPYELCPDRITGRTSHSELSRICPERQWRFVEINVAYTETLHHRARIMTLMYPHNTEMDLSISLALYFASRGVGMVRGLNNIRTPFTSTARVLLSGLGADELFGGYQRHATAYSRHGYAGLIEELNLDFTRLGKRNLGRDDRVISDSGKEVRFPYLDENVVNFALQLPVSIKCDFEVPQSERSDELGARFEPGKRLLRMLAWESGMKEVAMEKKRAIQFGARTAKMETGKSKGTHVVN